MPFVHFCFYFHYSRRWIQKNIVAIYVKDCSLFPPRSFIMSSLTRRSLIHFKFNFVYGVRECSDFILLRVAIHFFGTSYWRVFFWLFFITPFYLQKWFNTPDVCTFAPPMPCRGQPLYYICYRSSDIHMCMENPRDRGAWWVAVYGVSQSWTRLKWLSSSRNLVNELTCLCF